ncbi:hypothetical protein [Streptomyces sp. ST2-7A]|uniref:hypothetical protein n=1 Tax=Streptomyces sp. ST2-7A TaxID=2907214 RepID=UPI001F272CAA|nr:hypothetical protein [Streptomyces sp. ST2-7A]MCE7079585.1 hypothetical protein [Streptomyces sp. ST2-7A]
MPRARLRRRELRDAPPAASRRAAGPLHRGGSSEDSSQNGVVEPPDGRFRMIFGLRGFLGYQVMSPGVVWWFDKHRETRERSSAELGSVPHEHPTAPRASAAFEDPRRDRGAATAKQAGQTGAVTPPTGGSPRWYVT